MYLMSNPATIEKFPTAKLDDARDALAKAYARLVRGAAKTGQDAGAAPRIEISNVRVVSRCRECGLRCDGFLPRGECRGGIDCRGYSTEMCDVTIIADRPALAGWDFLAVVEPLDGGNLIRQVPGAAVVDGELSPWRTGAIGCDHCEAARRRSETFIVRADGSDPVIPAGTYRQVGRNCLAQFLGGKSAAAILAALAWPDVVRDCAGDDEDGFSGGRAISVLDPVAYLAWVAGVIREDGWVSRGTARDSGEGKRATADMATRLYFPARTGDNDHAADSRRCMPTEVEIARAAAALELQGRSVRRDDVEVFAGPWYDCWAWLILSGQATLTRLPCLGGRGNQREKGTGEMKIDKTMACPVCGGQRWGGLPVRRCNSQTRQRVITALGSHEVFVPCPGQWQESEDWKHTQIVVTPSSSDDLAFALFRDDMSRKIARGEAQPGAGTADM